MKGTVTLDKEFKKTGAVFKILIVNIAVLVVLSGRVPIILTSKVQGGLNFETKIVPLKELTPIRSIA
jgi:hypothetical protein